MHKIENTQTKEQIANLIREEILSGGILPEEELVQENLAKMLGVSRMPIREALQTLEVEGFLERMPNRHMRVIRQREEQIREIFSFVAYIEYYIISCIMKKIEHDDECQTQLEQTKKKLEGGYLSREEEFLLHLSFGEIFGNQYLYQVYTKILRGYIKFSIEICKEDRIEYLEKVIDSIFAGESEGILDCLSKYYEILAISLVKHWRENIEYEEFRED